MSYPKKEKAFDMAMITFRNFFSMFALVSTGLSIPVAVVFVLLDSSFLFSVILYYIFFLISLCIFLPVILAFIFSRDKKLLLSLPKLNKLVNTFTGQCYYSTVITKLSSRKFEIADFTNTFLEYWCKDDFAKYLIHVDVFEQPFTFNTHNFWTGKIKKEINDSIWKVEFIFSKVPKKGELKIEYY